MKEISFVVNGEPMAKKRPKVAVHGKIAHAYTPSETVNYENKVLMTYLSAARELGIDSKQYFFAQNEHIGVEITACFALNKGDFGKKGINKSGREKIRRLYCDINKDLDNIIKIIMDSVNGIMFCDDRQVVEIVAKKIYVENAPRVEVKFREITYGE